MTTLSLPEFYIASIYTWIHAVKIQNLMWEKIFYIMMKNATKLNHRISPQKLPTAIKMIFQTTVDKKMTKIMLMVASANPVESKNLMRMINNWETHQQ